MIRLPPSGSMCCRLSRRLGLRKRPPHVRRRYHESPSSASWTRLAKLEVLGVPRMSKGQAAAFAGASPKSSAFPKQCKPPADARSAGLSATRRILAHRCRPRRRRVPRRSADRRRPAGGLVKAAVRSAGPYPGIDYCRISRPIGESELAERAGASPPSSAFQNNLSALRSLGCSIIQRRGSSVATEILFPIV